MNPTKQLYEAAKAVVDRNYALDQIYRNLDKLQEAITAFEQEQPEAIAGENESAKDKEIAELKQRISVIKEKLPDNKIRDLNPIWVRDEIISELEKLI